MHSLFISVFRFLASTQLSDKEQQTKKKIWITT